MSTQPRLASCKGCNANSYGREEAEQRSACREMVMTLEMLPCEGPGFPTEDDGPHLIGFTEARKLLDTNHNRVRTMAAQGKVRCVRANGRGGTCILKVYREDVERMRAGELNPQPSEGENNRPKPGAILWKYR